MLPKDVAPLVWSTSGKSETLQSLLGLLLEVAWGKVGTVLGGVGLPVPRSRAVLSFPGAFPIPCPKASLQRQLSVWHV